jgi:hypothetical protein
MSKFLLRFMSILTAAVFLTGCNNPEEESKEPVQEEEQDPGENETGLDEEVDKEDGVDEDHLNEGGTSGEHELDIDEDGNIGPTGEEHEDDH